MSRLESSLSDVPLEVIENFPRIKVFNLNTCLSGRKYGLFEDILDFICKEEPDVVLLQEVFEGSLERIGNALGGQIVFSRMSCLSLTDKEEEAEDWGIAIGSKHHFFDIREDYYHGDKNDSNLLVLNGGLWSAASLLQAQLKVGSARFNFGTTQFTWVRGAEPSDEQLRDFARLDAILEECPDLVLTGDFNSPRGYPIFDSLAKRYRDNIPPEVETTLDAGVRPRITWEYVVDGFFTSEHYRASEVRLVQGLSDHQGILAEVQRVA